MHTSPPDHPEVHLVMRQFWPVLAGAAERMERHAPGLAQQGIRLWAHARLAQPTMAFEEESPRGVRVCRVAGEVEKSEVWDACLFDALLRQQGSRQVLAHQVIQTNLAFRHTQGILRRLRSRGHPTVWMGSMMGDITEGMGFWRRFRERLRLRWLFSAFDAHVVGSQAMRRWLLDAWVPQHRIAVIGHGVDLKRFRPCEDEHERSKRRAELGLPTSGPLILMVGTMTQRKGVDLLLEAWPQVRSQHPSAHLVLIGGTDRPTIVEAAQRARAATHQQKLQSLMEPGLQAGSIIRHDAVDCIEHWMRVADLLVLASEREGVPNVVLEAMASGTPCLLTPFLGLPREELGPCGEAWHLCQRNSAAIAQEMNCLLANANALPRWGRLAAEHAARNFALEDSVNAYASLYRGLVDARLSGA